MQELLKKLVKGDREAFEKIVKMYEKKMLVIACSRLKDTSLAYDAVQETFITLYLNANKIKDYNKLKSWLAVVLMNNCNKINKKKEYSEISFEDANLDAILHSDNEEFNKIFSNIDFYNCINFLNEEERTILALFYSEEYTINEISDILNINISTIKSKISRAKTKIKNHLGSDNNEFRR